MGIGSSAPLRAKPGLVVTLDALGTLYKFREPITTQYVKVAQRCGMTATIDESQLSVAFKKSFKGISEEYPNYGKGKLNSPRAWWKTIVNDSFRQVVEEKDIPDHLGEELYDHFTSSAAYELYDDVKPFFQTMRELKDQYLRLDDPPFLIGIITNSDPRVKSVLQSLGLRCGLSETPPPPKLEIKETWQRTVGSGSGSVPDVGEAMKSPWHYTFNQLNDIDFISSSYDADAEKPRHEIFDHAGFLANMNFTSRYEQEWKEWRPSFAYMKHKVALVRRVSYVADNSKYVHVGDDVVLDCQPPEPWESIWLKRDGAEFSFAARKMKVENQTEYDRLVDTTINAPDLGQVAAAIKIMAAQHLKS